MGARQKVRPKKRVRFKGGVINKGLRATKTLDRKRMGQDYRGEKSGERNWGETKMILKRTGRKNKGRRGRGKLDRDPQRGQGLGRDEKNTRGVGQG